MFFKKIFEFTFNSLESLAIFRMILFSSLLNRKVAHSFFLLSVFFERRLLTEFLAYCSDHKELKPQIYKSVFTCRTKDQSEEFCTSSKNTHWDFLCSDRSNLNLIRWLIFKIVSFVAINNGKNHYFKDHTYKADMGDHFDETEKFHQAAPL